MYFLNNLFTFIFKVGRSVLFLLKSHPFNSRSHFILTLCVIVTTPD